MTTDIRTACVKWFNPKSGYGFITDSDSKDDIFVHHSELQAGENVYRSLTTGEYIEYQLSVDQHGKSTATAVKGIKGGILLCETTAINIAERRERNASRGNDRGAPRAQKEEPRM